MSSERKNLVLKIIETMPADDMVYILDNVALGYTEEAELGCKIHGITLDEFSEIMF